MRNYIILNDKNSNTISGLIIQELAPISKPLQRTQVETIDGRDGDIVTPLGYAAYNKKIKIGLYGNFNINDIIAYFATKGTAIFSNEPDKYYYYQIVDQIDYDRLVRYRVATVTMHVQPFKYSATEGTITVDSSDTVSDEGSDIALDGTAEAPFNVLRHKGNATQKTTSGKNLFGGFEYTNTNTGATSKYNKDGTITISGTATSRNWSLTTNVAYDSNYMVELPAGTYTFTVSGGLETQLVSTNLDGTDERATATIDNGNGSRTFTITAARLVYARVRIETGTYNKTVVFMLEQGSSAGDYEPYTAGASPNPDYPQDIQVLTGDSTVKITGKNLLDASAESYTYQANSGSTYTTIGNIYMVAGTTYYITFDVETATTSNTRNTPYLQYGGAPMVYGMAGTNANRTIGRKTWEYTADYTGVYTLGYWSHTPSNDLTVGNFMIALQNDTTYEPYKEQSYVLPFGDTYLAKIGDYADEPVKVDGTWYIRRAIGKVVLDGTQNFAGISTHSGAFLTVNYGNSSIANLPDASIIGVMSNKFRGATLANTWRGDVIYGVGQNTTGHYIQFSFPSGTFADLDGVKAWFGSNNTIVYYVLATPTDEAITDQDLIDALDDFYDQAHSYKGHTHITATAADGNAPAVLSVEVGEDNESTVTNAGNTTSRPILTIYGQGDIGVYINDVEVLDVALGDEEYITLDSVEMEAYKDTTANLKNRLVTGDYSKLALNAGDNAIRFTGKVTKYEISKYSRWL